MKQRINVITLGVGDLERSRHFYEALGWKTNAAPGDDVVFFQAGGLNAGEASGIGSTVGTLSNG